MKSYANLTIEAPARERFVEFEQRYNFGTHTEALEYLLNLSESGGFHSGREIARKLGMPLNRGDQ
ncbi:hypothetical protein [Methanocella sp. MCL-LM]|uniref:hypothetical protein n=1 Tax=Methanocella sp. MCL-LM TaxID=3412035 RepID=UPI003C74AB49